MRTSCWSGVLVAALAAGWLGTRPVDTAAQSAGGSRKLQLTFTKGGVTLVAQNVTPRDIMIEWARLCGCTVRNGDKVPGGMITMPMEFDDQPESTVLASVLSAAAGYALGPRIGDSGGPSQYGVIAVFPVSHASASAYSSTSVAAPLVSTPDDELPPVVPIPPPGTPQPQNRPVAPGQSNGVPPGRSAGGPGVPVVPISGTGRGGGPGLQ